MNDQVKFSEYWKQLRVGFSIYADMETFCKPVDTCIPDSTKSSTTEITNLEPNSFGYKIVCVNEEFSKPTVVYRGENATEKFIQCMLDECERIKSIYNDPKPLNMSNGDEISFNNSAKCHICQKYFKKNAIKVRDHCHLTGKFRGAAHSDCNLKYKQPSFVPIVFHNLRNFDGHLLCQAIGKFKDLNINVIPNNMEKYVSFSIGPLKFIDSCQFLNASLECLVDNLAVDGMTHFNHFRKEFADDSKARLMLRKNVYPYGYCDSFERFEERSLPSRDKFYNQLSKSDISDADFEHAQNVWREFDMQNFGEFHDMYLLTDVALLACVFERFRDTCLEHYGLDPCWFLTSPGLSWSSALKMTECTLSLITDPTMYLFFEKGVRGGVSMITKRFSQSNNKHIPDDYIEDDVSKYIMYQDCTNLYGKAMSMPLPTGEMRWLTDTEIEEFDINRTQDDDQYGYILEVDLRYPSELHDDHNEYPLCPEHVDVTYDMLSAYNRELIKNGDIYSAKSKKLIPSLNDKERYIVHFTTLRLYLKLGLQLKKIHKIITFKQSPWLKKYIDFNTNKRKIAQDDFTKDFFKLMINAVFGKTLENLRSRREVYLVHTSKKLKKRVAKSSFHAFKRFNEDLVGVEHTKVKLLLNRPIFVGQAILDLSKTIMYEYHYNVIKKMYGENVSLLFTDTDSLMYEIETDDVYADMLGYKHLLDLSNYPNDHFLFDETNKKVIGTFKDETRGIPIKSFVGLKSKMYAFTFDNREKQIAKGVAKAAIKADLRYNHYRECLFKANMKRVDMNLIRSKCHELSIYRINKLALSPLDDKRYVLNDGIHTLAYGHHRIPTLIEDAP
ncbi:MAG: endonuclease domain-containing protein [Sedimenticola sp.]